MSKGIEVIINDLVQDLNDEFLEVPNFKIIVPKDFKHKLDKSISPQLIIDPKTGKIKNNKLHKIKKIVTKFNDVIIEEG